MNLSNVVKQAAKARGVVGKTGEPAVTVLAAHCKLDYRKVARVWKGQDNAKLGDIRQVLNSLGLDLEIVGLNTELND